MIVAALAVTTIAGMVARWPSGNSPSLKFIEGTAIDETHTAEIDSKPGY